jgi:hypothetical protein
MTCFWDGIITELTKKVFRHKFLIKRVITPIELIKILKEHVVKTVNIKWNNEKLKKKEIIENYEMIQHFNEKTINNGYLCSACEPFLLLICELFNVDIEHKYNGNNIFYKNIKNNNLIKLKFKSNSSHFSADS